MNSEIIAKLPKIELHNHLEGTISPVTFMKLVKRNSDDLYGTSLEKCKELYNFNTFIEFLQAFAIVNRYIRTCDDIRLIIADYLSRIKDENYKYIEFFLSIDTFLKKGFDLTELLDTIQQEFRKKSSPILKLNVDFVRNYGREYVHGAFSELKAVLDDYRDLILGISIGGDEENYPPILFKELYKAARENGLRTTVHTGEASNSDSMWEAILNLKPDRIGHGIKSIESLDLIKHLRATQTPVEVSITSNVRTNSVKGIENHPIRNLYEQGVNITINTDDSGFFDTSITKEFELCQSKFNFTVDELKTIIQQTSNATFLPPLQELELKDKINTELSNL